MNSEPLNEQAGLDEGSTGCDGSEMDRVVEAQGGVSSVTAESPRPAPEWVSCGMDEAFPRRVSLTFASSDSCLRLLLST